MLLTIVNEFEIDSDSVEERTASIEAFNLFRLPDLHETMLTYLRIRVAENAAGQRKKEQLI